MKSWLVFAEGRESGGREGLTWGMRKHLGVVIGSLSWLRWYCLKCIHMLKFIWLYVQFHSVQLVSHAWVFVTAQTAACQASLPFTTSWSLLKLMSIELVMLSNHLILCCRFSSCPKSFPPSGSFPMSQLFPSGGQSIGASASASALAMNIQDWFLLGLTNIISLMSKGLSRVFSNTTVNCMLVIPQ